MDKLNVCVMGVGGWKAISEVNQEISTRREAKVNWNFSVARLSISGGNWISPHQ
jgi:hypothetical protein